LRLRLPLLALLALAAGLRAAAAQPALECRGAQKPMAVAELLFGRSVGSETAWTRFVAREITPRFPDGLTIYDARGQWRPPGSQTITRERSKVVMIAMPGGAEDEQRLQQIVDAYKKQFRQQSVGLLIRPACVSF
jgi:hypothetical protein